MKLEDLEIHASPITNTIFAGKMNKGRTQWLDGKEDVTHKVQKAVSEWFTNEMLKGNKDAYFGYYLMDGRAIRVTAEIIEKE